MLRPSAIRSRKRNAPRPAWKVAEAFKQWLRGRPCAACESTQFIQAAHVDHAGGKGMGTKVADRHCIPLCATCHGSQHMFGWRTFEREHKMNAVDLAQEYWRAWPGRAKWEERRNG